MRPAAVVGIACGLVALLVVGYVFFGGDSDAGVGAGIRDRLNSAGLQAQDCSLRYGATPAEPAGVTAVLVDRSASARGESDAPDYPTALVGELRKAVERGDTVIVAGFDGTRSSVRWSVTETAFAGDPNRVDAARTDVVGCVGQRVADAARGLPDTVGSDVLGAIRAAQDPLAAAPAGHRSLVLATDGLMNTGCADLNVVPPEKDVTEVVDGCQDGLASLPDTNVTILALGDTAASDARPTRDQLTWLGSLWSTLCGRIATGTCSVATAAVDERIDNPAPPNAAVDDRVVWPVVGFEQSGGVVRVSLPDRLLFDTDSDELRPDATPALESVAGRVRAVSGTIVEVVGHTDGRGEVEYNDLLSLGRAQRVADALRANFGLDAPARGAGEREPKCSPETRPDGSPDPVALQCNRRVEVVIRLGQPS